MGDNLYTSDYGSFVGSEKGYCGFRNRLRIKEFTKLVDPKKGEVILEIGCNEALLTHSLLKYSEQVYGIDINKDEVKKQRSRKILCMSATDLKFRDGFFDKVCSFEVFEHIPDIGKAMSEVSRVLKPGGMFFVTFPMEIVRGQNAVMDAIRVFRNPLYARKLHVHKLSPWRIRQILEKGRISMSIVRSGMVLIPFPSWVLVLEKSNKK
jgi:SAM-dependent methyltransferase